MIGNKMKPIEIETYEEIFNALGTAVIYYDHNGLFTNSNIMAMNILPQLPITLNRFEDFISFVFEHSVDFHEQTNLSPSLHNSQKLASFCEIIRLQGGRFYMVRAITQDNKDTLVEISDISQIKNYTDDIKLLDRDNRILLQAIQSSQKGIFIAGDDDEKRIIFVNRSMDALLGREDKSILGYRLDAFLSTYFTDEWKRIGQAIAEGKGGRFWQKINKINEQHILQTQKMDAIGKLAGGVAHDFNNILSIVDCYIRLSETALKRGDNISENFERIKKAVKRGSGLTRQLLMFGKHRVSENKIVDLCAQVKDVESFLDPLLGVNFKVRIQTPDYPIFVRGSTDAIYQILMNLVINARDAMDGEGTVDILISEENGNTDHPNAILSVADNGCGISEHIIGKIFDPFFTTKEQGKGTGLGLSMVYGVAQQIGAEINVSSVRNEGTVFTINFPIIDDNDYLGPQKGFSRGYNNLRGKTILVAEDEEDLLVIIKSLLEDFGMKVLSAKNGLEALTIQNECEDKIDFLLTDIVMPELGGVKLASLIREVRPDINILFMSGYPDRGDTSNFDLPRDAIFIAKPVQPDFLRDVLEKLSAGESINQADAIVW